MSRWKWSVLILLIVAVIGQVSCFAAGEEDVSLGKMPHYEKYKGVMLDSSEVPNVSNKKTMSRSWPRGTGSDGKPLAVNGFAQEFQVENSPIKTRVKYGRFASTNIAHEALTFHVANVSIRLRPDPWPEAEEMKRPDEVLFSTGTASTAIIFRHGTTCVLISCHGGNVAERRKMALLFADRVISRLHAGRSDSEKR